MTARLDPGSTRPAWRMPLRTLALGSLSVALAIPSVGDTAPTLDSIFAVGTFRLNRLSGGRALEMARELLCGSDVVDAVLRAIDRNGDGALSFDEVLQVEPLSLARALEKGLFPNQQAEDIGDDVAVSSLTDEMQKQLGDYLELGVGNETTLPNIPLDELKGDPRSFLDGVASLPRTQARRLADLIADLDARMFPAGDMTGRNLHVNMERKDILMERADWIARHLRSRNLQPVRMQLAWLRARMDGAKRAADWVTGPKADVIVQQIDALLELIS